MTVASATNARAAFRQVYAELKEQSRKDPKLLPKSRFQVIFPDEGKWRDVGILPAGDVMGPYTNLRTFLGDWKVTGLRRTSAPTTVEAHHLLEDRLMTFFGITHAEGLCVALEQMDHSLFSAELPRHLQKKVLYDIDVVFDAHRIMYTEHGHRDWIPIIAGWLEKLRPRILGHYAANRVKGATEVDKKRVADFFAGLAKYR